MKNLPAESFRESAIELFKAVMRGRIENAPNVTITPRDLSDFVLILECGVDTESRIAEVENACRLVNTSYFMPALVMFIMSTIRHMLSLNIARRAQEAAAIESSACAFWSFAAEAGEMSYFKEAAGVKSYEIFKQHATESTVLQ